MLISDRYVNPITGKSVSLQEAMGMGDITVEFKSKEKVREEKSSYGIVSVTESIDDRPFTITGVIDPKTDNEISVDDAYKKGILDRSASTYTTETGEKMKIRDAIDSGLVKAEFKGEFSNGEKEETKTYAVNAVIDKKLKRKVSFHQAMTSGLLMAEDGMYVNNETGETMSITDAIMKGLIKARIVSDPSTLDINPENKIVVSKLRGAQHRIMQAVKARKGLKK